MKYFLMKYNNSPPSSNSKKYVSDEATIHPQLFLDKLQRTIGEIIHFESRQLAIRWLEKRSTVVGFARQLCR